LNSAASSDLGGIVGLNSGTVDNCFVRYVTLTSIGGDGRVGGIVGTNYGTLLNNVLIGRGSSINNQGGDRGGRIAGVSGATPASNFASNLDGLSGPGNNNEGGINGTNIEGNVAAVQAMLDSAHGPNSPDLRELCPAYLMFDLDFECTYFDVKGGFGDEDDDEEDDEDEGDDEDDDEDDNEDDEDEGDGNYNENDDDETPDEGDSDAGDDEQGQYNENGGDGAEPELKPESTSEFAHKPEHDFVPDLSPSPDLSTDLSDPSTDLSTDPSTDLSPKSVPDLKAVWTILGLSWDIEYFN
jgi:hypothetical protein